MEENGVHVKTKKKGTISQNEIQKIIPTFFIFYFYFFIFIFLTFSLSHKSKTNYGPARPPHQGLFQYRSIDTRMYHKTVLGTF